jgi:hypothetical protein
MKSLDGILPLGRVEAAIMAESALVDRETSRVFWEGGDSNTLYESLMPRLDQFGADHAQATLLTVVITLAFVSVMAGWTRKLIDSTYLSSQISPSSSQLLWKLVLLAEWTILKLPKIENKWLVIASVMLYLLESYNCSTRRFLSNAISNPTELDEYIENLRKEPPIVTWKVKSFHYELRRIFAISGIFRSVNRFLNGMKYKYSDVELLSLPIISRQHIRPMFPFTRKVVTNEASATFNFGKCHDDTMVGVWTRAQADDNVAPFTKIALTKLVVLHDKRSRDDYFQQQANFVTDHGQGDEFSEFSTDIQVAGYRPRILAVRNPRVGLFQLHLFWLLTFLGLTVPYRIWFKRHCDFVRVTIIKDTEAASTTSKPHWTQNWFPSRASIQPNKVGEAIFGGSIDDSKMVSGSTEGNRLSASVSGISSRISDSRI